MLLHFYHKHRWYAAASPNTRNLPKGGRVGRLHEVSFPLPCYPNWRALISTLVGLTAAEHVSLCWTHGRALNFTFLTLVPSKAAIGVRRVIVACLNPVKDRVLAIKADKGKEFAHHQQIAQALSASYYFALPFHSWERGLNEHTNGLVR